MGWWSRDCFGASVQQTHGQRDFFLKVVSSRRQRSKGDGCLYFSSFSSSTVSALCVFSSRLVKQLATLRSPIDPLTSLNLLGWHRPSCALQYRSWLATWGGIPLFISWMCVLFSCATASLDLSRESHPLAGSSHGTNPAPLLFPSTAAQPTFLLESFLHDLPLFQMDTELLNVPQPCVS